MESSGVGEGDDVASEQGFSAIDEAVVVAETLESVGVYEPGGAEPAAL